MSQREIVYWLTAADATGRRAFDTTGFGSVRSVEGLKRVFCSDCVDSYRESMSMRGLCRATELFDDVRIA